jgi:signal transduction histidine kinase
MYLPLDSTETLIKAIIIAFSLLFLILLAFLISGNYFISRNVWKPFYHTLEKLNRYDISLNNPLYLDKSSISEFRQLNKTLDQMSKKLQRDYMNLKEFNENASHEIQTPLAIIKSKLELLIQDEKLSEPQIKIINSVYESAGRMSKLNSGLLLISKIDNNQFPLVEKINFQVLIEKNIEHLAELISGKKIGVNLSFSQPVEIEMNRTLAEILVSNLLSNAIQHNSEGGSIEVMMERERFSISNTGSPLIIPPEELFERFRKSSRHSDSVGLGLAIVKRIVSYYFFPIDYKVNGTVHQITIIFRAGN